MKKEYDFSRGTRGKFYSEDATMHLPIYLEADIEAALTELAEAKGVDVPTLVNALLKKDIELIQLGH